MYLSSTALCKELSKSEKLGLRDDLFTYENPDVLCAEMLQLLRSGSWDTVTIAFTDSSGEKNSEGRKRKRNEEATQFIESGRRRKYTWRSLHHRSKDGTFSTAKESQEETKLASCSQPLSTQEMKYTSSSHKEQDKEWAALTTWLRMNLHQPRTNKRQVLFLADTPGPNEHWSFKLNPELSWDDVSEDTKLRLKSLPEETEAAYASKYPGRPSREWRVKTQKYRPPGATATVQVPLGEMVYSLQRIYFMQTKIIENDDSHSSNSTVHAF